MLRIYTAITNGVLTMQFAHLLGSHEQLATEKMGKQEIWDKDGHNINMYIQNNDVIAPEFCITLTSRQKFLQSNKTINSIFPVFMSYAECHCLAGRDQTGST